MAILMILGVQGRLKDQLVKLIGLVPLRNKIFWIGRKFRINFVTTLEKELASLVKIWLCGNKINVSNLYKNA